MPSTTFKAKGLHGCQRPAAPISERQQLALLMQISSVEQVGVEGGRVSPRSPSGSNPSPRGRNRNERGETPLHVAAIKGDHNQVKKLLTERGADPNATDFAGWTPLHEACNKGWYDVARVLLEAGASVNAQGYDDITPLHDAALNGHARLVRLLVSQGADVSQRNKQGRTPRDEAAPGLDSQLFQSETSDKLTCRVIPRDENQKKLVTQEYLPGNMDSKGTVEETKEEPSQTSEADKSTEKVLEESKSSPPNFDDDATIETGVKRSLQEVGDTEEGEEDVKKKKRRDSDATSGRTVLSKSASNSEKPSKTTSVVKSNVSGQNAKLNPSSVSSDHNSPVLAKPENEDDNEEMPLAKCLSGTSEGGPKVPPLKIVIPQQSTTLEQEQGVRNGKNGKSHQALPYVVASSNSNDSVSDKEVPTNPSPTDSAGSTKGGEDKKEALTAEERSHPRVLRSSHRSGGSSSSSSSGGQPPAGSVLNPSGGNNSGSNASSPQPGSGNSVGDRNSNNSSPHQSNSQGQSPSPDVAPALPAEEPPALNVTKPPSLCASPPAVEQVKTAEAVETPVAPSNSTPSVELHPRKRKLKQSKEVVPPPITVASDPPEVASVVPEVHPHDQPITNCYQLFLDIRKQIERRRKGLFPVQPKPPQGFKDYLMNRCTYVLAGNASSRLSIPNVTPPQSLQGSMKDLFTEQEKERYRLRMQHVIEKEKLVLSVEQEILRVHGRAARALANQTRPFSVCTILKDEEVYNVITPEQEEKDRNARSRYNGRLFLSWLQDVDDKWEKIKESMCLRHHNEAESLHAVQKMDWEWKMKELGICEFKAKPVIEDVHVPMVHVSDDFDLLPA